MSPPLRMAIFLFLAFAFQAPASAAPADGQGAGDQTAAPAIRLLVPELPMIGERDAQGHPKGMAVEQAQAILDRAGVHAEILLLPVVRVYTELARTKGGTTPPLVKTYGMLGLPLRDPYRGIVPLALTSRHNLIAITRPGVRLKTLDDLRHLGPIAMTITGTSAFSDIIRQYDLAVQEVPSMANGLKMLAHGRVGALLDVDAVIDLVARDVGLTTAQGDRLPLATMEGWLVCDPATAEAPETALLRKAAEALYREGRLDTIADHNFRRAAGGS